MYDKPNCPMTTKVI